MAQNLIAQFEVSIPKSAKALAKFVGKDKLRPIMQYVCINPSEGFMAATDTHILQMVKLPDIVGEYADGMEVLIDPKHVAKVAGKHVTISVYEDKREVEETHSVYGGAFCGSRTVTEKVTRTFQIVTIERNGETLTTETKEAGRYPQVKRAIPKPDGRKNIRLTSESLEALKSICKLHKDSNYIAMDISEGVDFVTVCAEVADYTIDRASYTLKLAAPAELTTTVGFANRLLSTCLNGTDGVMLFDAETPQSSPIMFGGEAEATLLMPYNLEYTEQNTTDYINASRPNICPAQSLFAEDAAAVVAELQKHATELWQAIINFHTKDGKCSLTTGNYAAKDLADRNKAKCGYYIIPDSFYEAPLTMKHGNISLSVSYENLFGLLAAWEAAVKCQKSVFSVGCVEEVTATEAPDSSIRAKVLQYKSDGNTLTEKQETLKKLAEGVYYTTEEDGYGNTIHGIVFEENGVFWWSRQALRPEELNRESLYCQRVMELRRNYRANIAAKAANNGFISTLEIEVHKRLGEDIAQLVASREAYLRHREEEERQKAEDAARRDQQRMEAEERRKAELLADGKEKLLNHKAITVEQMELVAEAVGYVFNIRTLGTLRRRVSMIEVDNDGMATVYGTKQRRGLDGTFEAISKIYNLLKSQEEEAEANRPATATETPQISTEAAEVVECAAEDEMPHDAAYMEPYNIKYFVDKHGDLETLARNYETAVQLKNSMLDEYKTDSHKGGRFRKQRMARLANEINALKQEHEDIRRAMILYFRNNAPQPHTIAPQPPETPPKVNYTTPTAERSHNANKHLISA